MDKLEQLRKRLSEAKARAKAARDAAHAEGATEEQIKAYSDAIKDATIVSNLLKAAEEEERLEALDTKDANAPVGGAGNGHTVYAEPELKVEKEQEPLLHIAAQLKCAIFNKQQQESGSSERMNPVELMKNEGYGTHLKRLHAKAMRQIMSKAAVGAVVSTTGSSVLLPQPVAAEILPILRPETTFLQGNPKRVELIGGVYRQARGTGSATAAYVGEGEKKPIGKPTFDDLDMRAHKLAGIVVITNEAVKWTIGNIEQYIRDDLRTVLGEKMDSAMYFGTGSGANPTGLFNQAGITTFDGLMAASPALFANNRKPTVGELDALATKMILSLTASNLRRNERWAWVMGYRFWSYLQDLRDGNGNAIFPTVANFQWKGIRILVSNQFPETGGANTDEGVLGLVDFSHVLYAEEEGMTMKTSTEATLNDDGTLVHLWQENKSAILAEMSHDVGIDNVKAVAQVTHLRAGSASSVSL